MQCFVLLVVLFPILGHSLYAVVRGNIRMGLGNSFGKVFRISTFGESHGKGVGVIIDGCPPRIPLDEADIQIELDRRKPGQSRLTTPRDEEDIAEIYSGVSNGLTTGTPIGIIVKNKDQRSKDYDDLNTKYRPSHADATYDAKYGVRAVAGGGRSSARETIGRVAAGAIAKKILKLYSNVEIIGYVQSVQDVKLVGVDYDSVTQEMVRNERLLLLYHQLLLLEMLLIILLYSILFYIMKGGSKYCPMSR